MMLLLVLLLLVVVFLGGVFLGAKQSAQLQADVASAKEELDAAAKKL
jgi:hypothetical protein